MAAPWRAVNTLTTSSGRTGTDRPQDDAVDESENGGVDPDGDRKGENRDRGEARRLDQLPESEP